MSASVKPLVMERWMSRDREVETAVARGFDPSVIAAREHSRALYPINGLSLTHVAYGFHIKYHTHTHAHS